jgi:hypothetical protein
MFVGKSICLIAAGVITGVCLLCVKDKKVSMGNKIKLTALTLGLCAIVWSL